MYVGVGTDQTTGAVLFLVTGESLDEVHDKLNDDLAAACDEDAGDTFDPFVFTNRPPEQAGTADVVSWAKNATGDFAQVMHLNI